MIRDQDGNIVRNEDGTPVGSVDVNELPGAEADEDLSKLSKAELVERAEAAGIDTQGLLKADLVDALEGDSNEEVADGDDGTA
jgi:hypothetical protein